MGQCSTSSEIKPKIKPKCDHCLDDRYVIMEETQRCLSCQFKYCHYCGVINLLEPSWARFSDENFRHWTGDGVSDTIDNLVLDYLKSIGKKYIERKIRLPKAVLLEFMLKNPGICRDYEKYCSSHIGIGRPMRDMAPCFFKNLELSSQLWDVSNTGILEFSPFGIFKTISIPCPDRLAGCEVLHCKSEVYFSPEHISLHEKFNSINLSYPDILNDWKEFYDNKLTTYIEEVYNRYFACQLREKCFRITGFTDCRQNVEHLKQFEPQILEVVNVIRYNLFNLSLSWI